MAFEFDRSLFQPDTAEPAQDFLVNQIARQALPYWNSVRSRNFLPPPISGANERKLLAAREHVRPFGDRPLNFFNIHNHLVRLTGGTSQCADTVRDVLDCPELVVLANQLAVLGRQEPELVRDLLAGYLKRAATSLPKHEIAGLEKVKVQDVVIDVAFAHHAGNVQRQARVAFNRFFEPTGYRQLDDNGGALVTVRSAATALYREGVELGDVLSLEKAARSRTLDPDEELTLERLGLIREAEAMEQQFRTIYGADFDFWYEEMICVVRYWTRYIRRGANAARKCKANERRALYSFHGPSALPALYLSLNYAVAWAEKRPKTGKFKDDESPETSALGDAVHAIIAGEKIVPPVLHPRHAEGTRILFFVLRNLCVRDPRAFIHKAELEKPDVAPDELIMEPVETAWGQHRGEGPLRVHDITTDANELDVLVHVKSDDLEAERIRGEMLGSILVQLQT